MTRYEVEFYENIATLTKAMQDISKDIHAIREHLVPSKEKTEDNSQQFVSYTYGEICKMKEDFEKCMEYVKRCEEFRNDQ